MNLQLYQGYTHILIWDLYESEYYSYGVQECDPKSHTVVLYGEATIYQVTDVDPFESKCIKPHSTIMQMKGNWIHAWFQAFLMKQIRPTLFWIIMQLLVVIPYRRFRTTYLPSRMPRNVRMFTWSFCNFYYYNYTQNFVCITHLQILRFKLLPVQQVQGIFLLSKTSTLALETTEPPIQWLQGFLSGDKAA